MTLLKKLVSSALTPLLNLNIAGMALAVLWLGSLEQWQVLGVGVGLVLFSPFVIPIVLLPAGIFSRYMMFFHQMGRPRGERVMLLLSLGYVIAFITMWCVYFFDFVVHAVLLPQAHLPALLWGVTGALGPLLWWVSKDRENIFIITVIEAAQVGLLGLALARLFYDVTFWPALLGLGVFLALIAAAVGLWEKKQAAAQEAPPR